VIEASRPSRELLRLIGRVSFPYDPDLAAAFADVNTTRTLEEERQDLRDLLKLIEAHRTSLVGLPPQLETELKALLEEAEGHGLLKALGLADQKEGGALRNLLLTYAVVLGRKAIDAGKLAFFSDPELRQRFQAFSLANALRNIQEPGRAEAEKETPTEDAKPEGDVH
jgi:hypothetical protein